MSRSFLHVVNPVVARAGSDLVEAQPVTFAAMEDARQHAVGQGVAVYQCAVGYPEDKATFPPGFHVLPDLTVSVLDRGLFGVARKLPLLSEIVARALDAADRLGAETVVYTNVDIAPMPDFYLALGALLDHGHEAFCVNRRTLAKHWPGGVNDLPLMRAQVGEAHPGRDCFVFGRDTGRAYDLGEVCIGAQYVGKVLAANMMCRAVGYEDFEDLHLTFHLGADRSWLVPALEDYNRYNRRELGRVLGRLRAAGLSSAHPGWKKLVDEFSEGAARD